MNKALNSVPWSRIGVLIVALTSMARGAVTVLLLPRLLALRFFVSLPTAVKIGAGALRIGVAGGGGIPNPKPKPKPVLFPNGLLGRSRSGLRLSLPNLGRLRVASGIRPSNVRMLTGVDGILSLAAKKSSDVVPDADTVDAEADKKPGDCELLGPFERIS